MIENSLKALGLSNSEIRVYMALLPLESVPASAVAARLKIPRPTAKYTCEQLEKKGLVSALVKNNTYYYTAREPDILYSVLTTEKRQLEKKEIDLGKAMGSLKQLFRAKTQLPKIRFFEGPEGIIKMFDDVIKSRQPIYSCLYVGNIKSPVINDYINNVYIPQRQNAKMPAWAIFNDTEEGRNYKQKDNSMNRISLLAPEEAFPFEICFHIYGNKVAFYSYKKEDCIGIVIEDKHIRNMQFSMFKMAWNFARMLPINKAYAKVELD